MEQFITQNFVFVSVLAVWSLIWKGMALWKSARLGNKNWYYRTTGHKQRRHFGNFVSVCIEQAKI